MPSYPTSPTGVYGGILADFPEQFQNFTWWTASANFNDGWTPTGNKVYLRGIFHNDKSGISNSNGMTVNYAHYLLWTTALMSDGDFITWNNQTYRVLHDNDWTTQDGYTQYIVNLVIGSNGTTPIDPQFSNGGNQI